jgi:hypothetical protein
VKDIGRANDVVPRAGIVGKTVVIEGVCSVNARETELFLSVIIKHIKFEETEKMLSVFHSQKFRHNDACVY